MKIFIKLILVFILINQVLVGQSLFDSNDYIKFNNKTYVYIRVSTDTQFNNNGKLSFEIKNISKDNLYIFTSSLFNFEETLNRINLDSCQVNTYYDNFQNYFPYSGISKYNFNKIASNDLFRINASVKNSILEKCPEIYLLCHYITLKNDLQFYTKTNENYYLIPLDDIGFHSTTLSCQTLNKIKVDNCYSEKSCGEK